MVMIPVGSDGEPMLELVVKQILDQARSQSQSNDPRKKWDIPYHR
jgi:hypothetical protein